MRYNVAQHCDLIWNWITENIKESLLISNSIKSTGSHNYQYTVQLSREEYERCLVEYAANFWAFGAVSHNNIHFYHFYKDKNNDYIIKNHYQGIAITIKKKLEEQ